MNLYLRKYRETIKDEAPFPDMSDRAVAIELALIVLSAISGIIGLVSAFLAGAWVWPFILGFFVLLGIAGHIETMARIKDKTRVPTEECQ
jgi:hypothetical protein